MSSALDLETILRSASGKEEEYDWMEAAKSYKKAMDLVAEKDSSRMGEICELLGHAFYRAGFQAESSDEFRERMQQAVASIERARRFNEELSEPLKTPRMLRCDAMIACVGYWLTSEAPEKKRLLDKSWQFTKDSLKALNDSGMALEYGKTYNQLASSAFFGLFLEGDLKAREKKNRELIENGESAIKFLSTLRDSDELAKAYVKTANYMVFGSPYFILNQDKMIDQDKRKRHHQKIRDYWLKANELSEETAIPESLSAMGVVHELDWGTGTDTALGSYKKALEYGRKTKDKLIIGCALEWLGIYTFWRTLATEDPDERVELGKRALQYAEDAKHQYSYISFISPNSYVLWSEAPHPEYFWQLANYEINLNKRGELLEKAEAASQDLLKQAHKSGYLSNFFYAYHVLSKILASLATIETSLEEKKRLLEKALDHRREASRLSELLFSGSYWQLGGEQKYLADIKSELADLAKDPEIKKKLLEEAILDKENSLKLCIEYLTFDEKQTAQFAWIGNSQYQYGNSLSHLYGLTNNIEHLRKAAKAFDDAAESFNKLDLANRMAECYWKSAQTYNALDEHLKAVQTFTLASNRYRSAAEKIPQLKSFYEDHALYMQAWAEIEKARHYHKRQEYDHAKEYFEKAADLHKSLKQWSYLTPNYAAWSQVEGAEELSRKEQNKEAIKALKKAINLFIKTKESLQTQLKKIEDANEKQVIANMVNG